MNPFLNVSSGLSNFRKRKRKKTDKSSSLSMFAATSAKTTTSTSNSSSSSPSFALHHHQPTHAAVQKAKEQQAAALAIDPSIFDFDARLTEREQAQKATGIRGSSDRTPSAAMGTSGGGGSRYISDMLKKTEQRKKEQERAYNKMQRRKADQEAASYGDTEKFVTPAYKALLEQEEHDEEQERQMESRDAAANGSGKGSFLANITQRDAATSASTLNISAPQKLLPASLSSSSSSSSSSYSSSSSSSTSLSRSAAPNIGHQQRDPLQVEKDALELVRIHEKEKEVRRIADEEKKTSEKVVAARARYMLRKATRYLVK